jgi:hypothetical protein
MQRQHFVKDLNMMVKMQPGHGKPKLIALQQMCGSLSKSLNKIGGGCGLLRTRLWLVLPAIREISGRILQRCHLQVEVFKHKAAISAINSGFIKIIAGRKFTQAGRL